MSIYKTSFTRAQIEEALNRALNVVTEGKSFTLKGEWTSGGSYANAASTIDVVLYDGVSYFCRVTHSGRSTNPKADATYWGQLAGYEPLIKNAAEADIADADALIFVDASDNDATKKVTFEDFKMLLPAGGGGAPLQLRVTATHIQWRAVGETDWADLVALSEITGPSGKSIVSITRTSGTGAPGTVDTYTITYTDSTTATFQVYNGADGEGSGDMTKAVYDTDGDGKVDAAEVADTANSVDWSDVQDKPSSMTPTSHATTHKTGGGDALTPADIGAAASSHTHTPSAVGLGNVDNVKQMPIAGGTFTGAAVAQTNTSYTTRQLRNVVMSTSDPSGGSNGDIWIKYT